MIASSNSQCIAWLDIDMSSDDNKNIFFSCTHGKLQIHVDHFCCSCSGMANHSACRGKPYFPRAIPFSWRGSSLGSTLFVSLVKKKACSDIKLFFMGWFFMLKDSSVTLHERHLTLLGSGTTVTKNIGKAERIWPLPISLNLVTIYQSLGACLGEHEVFLSGCSTWLPG